MATYRRRLKDKNGDIIIPAVSVQTSEIENSAVTNTKVDWSTFMQTGTANVTYQASGSAGGFVAVTFDAPFTNVPIVLVQDVGRNGQVTSLTASNVTTTGFDLLARQNSGTTNGTVNWIAISPTG